MGSRFLYRWTYGTTTCYHGYTTWRTKELPNHGDTKGFQDPNECTILSDSGESDVNRLAINETAEVPDTTAVGGGNQVVEFNGGDPNDKISKQIVITY